MNQEINKYLTEAMGLTYVKSDNKGNVWIEIDNVNIGKITIIKGGWELFGMRWSWAIKQEWWDGFWDYIYDKAGENYVKRVKGIAEMSPSYFWQDYFAGIYDLSKSLVNPEKFSNAIYNFLKERHEKE